MLKKDPIISDIALETALTLADSFGGKKKSFTFSACRLSSQDLDFTVENSEDLLKFPFILTDLAGKEENSACDIPYSVSDEAFDTSAELYIISDNVSKKSLKRISKMINNGVRVSFIIPFKKNIPDFLSEETGSDFAQLIFPIAVRFLNRWVDLFAENKKKIVFSLRRPKNMRRYF